MAIYMYKDYNFTPGNNTIAYYPLHNNSNDASGNSRNLTNTSVSFKSIDGIKSAYFNGGDAVLTHSSFYNLAQGDYTINLWAYRLHKNNAQDYYLLATGSLNSSYKGQSLVIEYDDNRLRLAFWYDDLDSTINPSEKWVNICVQFKKSTNQQFIYVNGVLNNSRTTSYTHSLSQLNFALGSGVYSETSRNRRGYLSEVIIENKLWTSQEISDYYNSTKQFYGNN